MLSHDSLYLITSILGAPVQGPVRIFHRNGAYRHSTKKITACHTTSRLETQTAFPSQVEHPLLLRVRCKVGDEPRPEGATHSERQANGGASDKIIISEHRIMYRALRVKCVISACCTHALSTTFAAPTMLHPNRNHTRGLYRPLPLGLQCQESHLSHPLFASLAPLVLVREQGRLMPQAIESPEAFSTCRAMLFGGNLCNSSIRYVQP